MLEEYKKKRKFQKTPEPLGKKQKNRNQELIFVVQKHKARNLHYDLRLEMKGVLKSWAVPKGPAMNPNEKRLAIMVEDHPLEYKDFEGLIPKGNYGAGEVIIWDEGTITAMGAKNYTESEQRLLEGLKIGHMTFIMNGSKLKGEFALVRLRKAEENTWLLIKANDKFAQLTNNQKQTIPNWDKSVISGKKIEEIAEVAKNKGEYWSSKTEKPELTGKKSLLPKNIKPMMSTLVKEPFDDKNWIFEIKWDGYRAITEISDISKIKNKNIRIYSRNNKDFNKKFPEIVNGFQSFDRTAVLDGEIVAVDDKGRPSFQVLQDYQLTGKGNLIYYVFDCLYFDGHDIREKPLLERKSILSKILPKVPNIQISEHIFELGKEFFQASKEQGLEGIMAKNIKSTYQTGKRSKDWLKIKNVMEQEFVIGGFTAPRGSRADFGSLALGVYEKGNLKYIGNVGTGFDTKLLKFIREKLDKITVEKSPFINPPRQKDITWVEPTLVCEVKFQEWTSDGSIRQPVFLGLREDLNPKSVKKEIPK